VLTTVCGGFLGAYLHHRHAHHQWIQSRWEKELRESQKVFEELSRLLDRRLYRTRLFLGSFARSREEVELRLAGYRRVVTQWNDNINRLLALLSIYFGEEMRNTVDDDLGEEFRDVGCLLEKAYRAKNDFDADPIDERVNILAAKVYIFNIRMLEAIQSKRDTLFGEARRQSRAKRK
jgi:hypothetical protein